MIIFEKQEDFENIYFVAYSLWKSKFWHQFLIGSVIPFLRIKDIEKEFYKRVEKINNESEEHKKNIAALKLLEEQENYFNKNLKLINDIRNVLLYKYCKALD